jgi:hypothetical protein
LAGAWGILPIFSSYNNTNNTATAHLAVGTHQIPLIAGPFPTELLHADVPLAAIIAGIKNKKYKVETSLIHAYTPDNIISS